MRIKKKHVLAIDIEHSLDNNINVLLLNIIIYYYLT